jgi:PKD domain
VKAILKSRAILPCVISVLSWGCGDSQPVGPSATPTATATTTPVAIATASPSPTVAALQINYCYGKPQLGTPGSPTSFDANVTGGAGAYSFLWQFADGTTSTSRGVAHTYTGPGEFTATLTVSTRFGETATCQQTVRVAPPGTACVVHSGTTPATVPLVLSAGDIWGATRSGLGQVQESFPGGSGSGGYAGGNAIASPWPMTFQFPGPPVGDGYAILVCH